MTTIAPVQSKPMQGKLRLLPLEAGDHLDQQTFHARYEAMPPGTRAELIGGKVYMPSPVGDGHSTTHTDTTYWLAHYKTMTPGVSSRTDGTAILGDDSEPQPDVALRIVTGGQTHLNANSYLVGCPELVCEVAASSASYDLHEKLADYDRYGAREYVAVLVRMGVVRWFRRNAEGRLAEIPADADGFYRSTAFPGLWLDPAALIAGDTKKVLEVLTAGLATAEHAAFAAELAGRTT